MRAAYNPSETYEGDGATTAFESDIVVTTIEQLVILNFDSDGEEVFKVRGNDTEFISSLVLRDDGFDVEFIDAPEDGSKLVFLQMIDGPTQPFSFRNLGGFTLSAMERALDWICGWGQTHQYLIDRSLKLNDIDDNTDVSMVLPAGVADNSLATIIVNEDGDGFTYGYTQGELEAFQAACEAAAEQSETSAAASSASETLADQHKDDAIAAQAAAEAAQAAAEAAEAAAAASAVAAAASASAAITGGPFVIADNNVVAADITNLKFLTASQIATFAFAYTRGLLGGVARLQFYKDGSGTWIVAPPLEDGDPSGLTFTLVTVGLYQQVQYVSDATGAGTAAWTGANV